MGVIVFLMIVIPYWVLALLPYFIQRRNKGKNFFYSLFAYIICIGSITLAKYQWFGSAMPGLDFDEEDVAFYLMVLPFVIVIILAAVKDFNYRYERREFN